MSLDRSATQRRIEQQLAESIALLKRANRYVGTRSSNGGQALGVVITEFIAAVERQGGTRGN